ncbi:hypothetical protein [Amycolatopsis thermoflava]|uniref:hypothetical protein n=1 Tax=Amycolatopsis thermoflava TaxID=84480 RepID=UPI000403C2EE|nr:hypothetical protein [Amycolatopsis thermoflava]
MPPKRKTPFVSVNLTVQARDALQRAALLTSAEVGRRLSMSAVLLAAIKVTEDHPAELIEALTGPDASNPKEGDSE